MEIDSNRTLAFQLAKTISKTEMEQVTGGGTRLCMRPTCHFSQGDGEEADTTCDLSIDI
jgi:bacteriocin-like protein